MIRKPRAQRGLGPRNCEVCGDRFQPYRASQTTCSLAHYKQSSRYREIQRKSDTRPERMARKNELRRTNPQQVTRVREYNRKTQLARYGLTPDDYDRMLAEQGGVCRLCGRPPNPDGVRAASKLHADHDHETGRSRDLLCLTCNHMIGAAHDNPALLRKAAKYIERHRALVAEGKI